MFAPRGTGFLWGKSDAWRQTRPTIPAFDPDGMVTSEAWMNRRQCSTTADVSYPAERKLKATKLVSGVASRNPPFDGCSPSSTRSTRGVAAFRTSRADIVDQTGKALPGIGIMLDIVIGDEFVRAVRQPGLEHDPVHVVDQPLVGGELRIRAGEQRAMVLRDDG